MALDGDLFRRLVLTLLDFQRRPGRYAVLNRSPRLLFDNLHTVLLLAAGKELPLLTAMKPGPKREARARAAARYFVRTVLLRPGASPEMLLGLPKRFDARTVREHYRLMMRMAHPDMHAAKNGGGKSPWPADAAQRINLAHQTLSNGSSGANAARIPGVAQDSSPRKLASDIATSTAPVDLDALSSKFRWLEWRQQWRSSPPLMRAVVMGAAATVSLTGLAVWTPNDNAASLQIRPSTLSDRPSLKMTQAMLIDQGGTSTPQQAHGRAPSSEETLVLMTNLIAGLYGGRGQPLLEWVDPTHRADSHNQAFIERIDQVTGGRQVRKVQALSMSAVPQGIAMQVTALVAVDLEDEELESVRRNLRINALFELRNNHATLVRVSAIPR